MTRSGSRAVTALAVLLGTAMIAGGAMKIAGETHQVTSFALWGLPPWFRTLVGTFEIIGGILLIAPATAAAGSLILATIMVGATWTHAAHGEWTHIMPAAGVLALLVVIFRRNQASLAKVLDPHEPAERLGDDDPRWRRPVPRGAAS